MAAPNFPTKPQRRFDVNSFPNDLVSGQRQFYTSIIFMDYKFDFGSLMSIAVGGGGQIKLPMPRRLNDAENIIWEEWSGTNFLINAVGTVGSNLPVVGGLFGAAAAGAQGLIDVGSVISGQTLNPYMFMMFKRPAFKEHVLQWTLTPNSQQESDTLIKIINKLKKAALPETDGALMKYPKIAQVTLKAAGSDKYLYQFKPCAIVSVQAEHTAAGMPSFFKNGAPTAVNLTLQLKEIQLWKSQDIQDS